jgi:hypothetical protein
MRPEDPPRGILFLHLNWHRRFTSFSSWKSTREIEQVPLMVGITGVGWLFLTLSGDHYQGLIMGSRGVSSRYKQGLLEKTTELYRQTTQATQQGVRAAKMAWEQSRLKGSAVPSMSLSRLADMISTATSFMYAVRPGRTLNILRTVWPSPS